MVHSVRKLILEGHLWEGETAPFEVAALQEAARDEAETKESKECDTKNTDLIYIVEFGIKLGRIEVKPMS